MQAKKLYFGYGSNLDPVDWQKWCIRKGYAGARLRPLTGATLPDHEPAFAYESGGRKCGVLDLRLRPGQLTNGVIFEANDYAWGALSEKEGDGIAYESFDTIAIDSDGNEVPVTSYRVL